MSIEVKNVSKSYDNNLVLNNINFNVQKGEIVGFLGINGAGKSTMMKMICSYIKPNSGHIFVCKKNVQKNAKYTKQKIGYLSENNPLYEDMYVTEFLLFISKIYNLKKNINNIIKLTGLKDIQKKKIKILSAGQKQRVGIAQAIIHNPDVLILDEPTAKLDPNQKNEIQNLIKTLGSKKAILFSTHILEEAEKICDRIIIIHKGDIIVNQKRNEFDTNLYRIFQKLTNQ
jgi:ABC-2 type transport system ATP-binding protein